MANRTSKGTISVHGTNPQFLMDQIVRNKIYNCMYWKQYCYALTAETLIDRAVKLEYIGGTFGGFRAPCKFLCLIQKLLQIQPDMEIIQAYIENEDYKYIRALGAFYLRLVAPPKDCFEILEPLYNDYSKLRVRNMDGKFEIIHTDELIEKLLAEENLFDVNLPRLPSRYQLEEQGVLEIRVSGLEIDLESDNEDEENNIHIRGIEREMEENKEQEIIEERERSRSRDKHREEDIKELPRGTTFRGKGKEVDGILYEEGSKEYWNAQRKLLGIKPMN